MRISDWLTVNKDCTQVTVNTGHPAFWLWVLKEYGPSRTLRAFCLWVKRCWL